jgi:excisionase family DNA binding protein
MAELVNLVTTKRGVPVWMACRTVSSTASKAASCVRSAARMSVLISVIPKSFVARQQKSFNGHFSCSLFGGHCDWMGMNEKTASPENYISKTEVADRLGMTARTIEHWMQRGIIPYLKIGKGRRATVLFKWADIEAHLKANYGVGQN